jgi:hypothetical protein
VDVVVQHNLSFRRDLSRLPLTQKLQYNGNFGDASYGAKEHRAEVLRALQRYFGAAVVVSGPKAIKVTTPNGRTVDVIPALEYRDYVRFATLSDQSYISGISFDDLAGQAIVNFPKQHMQNGEAKNAAGRTNGKYKQTIRMFKNARSCAVDKELLADDVAPSYFIECLLYNVPDSLFVSERQQTFENIWNFLWSRINVQTAVCQNGRAPLFGTSPQQWTIQRAASLLTALQHLWNRW